ncbi:toxin-antitoxin system HicB family antitoxin [Georgenia halophila]|uniref:Toxin-antitoxin system HicB family antitoxin n=1 Tax=Georgenia halophila TaxID=620889 RepID=A0ABP8LE06_9MICO
MDLGPYLSSLQQALAATARASTTEVQEAADRLVQSLEPALRLTLMELAADVADETTVQLDGDLVEVRLRGGSPEVVVQQRPRAADAPVPPPPPAPPAAEDDGGTARISLRLPDGLKAQVDKAATEGGVSVNAWLVRAAQQALNDRADPARSTTTENVSSRLSGWAR